MNSENPTSASTILLAVLGGAALGAGLALLYAPQSGRRTRQKIREFGEDAEEQARDMFCRGEGSLEEALKKGGEWIQKGQEFVEEKKRQVAEAADVARGSR